MQSLWGRAETNLVPPGPHLIYNMQDFMTIFKKVKNLELPIGQYVVFGSGPLEAYGIRQANDIELFVTKELYIKLKASGWEEKEWPNEGGHYLQKDDFEADDTWHYGDYNPTPEELIAKAQIINGVPFAPLEEVRDWKLAFGRTKDIEDVKMIVDYFSNPKTQ